jgi:hypothetical protein
MEKIAEEYEELMQHDDFRRTIIHPTGRWILQHFLK